MPRGATCSRTSKPITIVGGSTPLSVISPQSRQTGKPPNPVSTFPGEGQTRKTKAAKRFLGKALNGLKDWEKPRVINTDKAPTYGAALAELKKEGKCPKDTQHRQGKYLNNVIEADHGKLKQLIRPVRGFKTLKTAYATIKGFEVMRALRKNQAAIFNIITRDIHGEARLVEHAFGLSAAALAEARQFVSERLEREAA